VTDNKPSLNLVCSLHSYKLHHTFIHFGCLYCVILSRYEKWNYFVISLFYEYVEFEKNVVQYFLTYSQTFLKCIDGWSEGKVVSVLAMKIDQKEGRGCMCIAPLILNLDTRWMWVFSFVPWWLTSREIASGWIGGLVSPKVGLDTMKKGKLPFPYQEASHNSSVCECVG